LDSACTLLEISTPRHPRTSKKQGKGQADGCDQASHRGSLAENVGIGESGWMSPYGNSDGLGENPVTSGTCLQGTQTLCGCGEGQGTQREWNGRFCDCEGNGNRSGECVSCTGVGSI